MKRQRLVILGSTGSIGTSTLDVVSRHPERFEVLGLSAQQRTDELIAQCLQWRPRWAVLPDEARARMVRDALRAGGVATEVLAGAQALCDMAADAEVDSVMAAIVGAAGLPPCLAAASAASACCSPTRRRWSSAVRCSCARCGRAGRRCCRSTANIPRSSSACRSIAASGLTPSTTSCSPPPAGFRSRDPATLGSVTPDEACAHPNWVMGRKISVDSATMMNKALEVIEARWLFDLQPEQIKVVIHPQSIIHSMVVCRDGSVLAQLGTPDMRGPISYGLSFPQRIESGAARLDFPTLSALSFEEADARRFPGLQLSWSALRGPEGSSAVLNAANEVAVAAFLDRRLRFDAIHAVNADTVAAVPPAVGAAASLDDLLALDERARAHARQCVRERAR